MERGCWDGRIVLTSCGCDWTFACGRRGEADDSTAAARRTVNVFVVAIFRDMVRVCCAKYSDAIGYLL